MIFFNQNITVADLKNKPVPIYMLPCRIWSFCVKACRHKYRRTPKIWEPWNFAFLGWKAWLNPRYTHLPDMYYNVNGSSATKGVYINRREPPNWGALGPAP